MRIVLLIIIVLLSIWFGGWICVIGAEKNLLSHLRDSDLPDEVKKKVEELIFVAIHPLIGKKK